MRFSDLRNELKQFYWHEVDEAAAEFARQCCAELDTLAVTGMSVAEQKCLQYRVITERFTPKLFAHSPFYYETGTMAGICDGARHFRGHTHAGCWTYDRNSHVFIDQDPDLWELRSRQIHELFYLLGTYHDVAQHFAFNYRPIYRHGLRGIYEQANAALAQAETPQQRQFYRSVCEGMLCLKRIAEKFSKQAAAHLAQGDRWPYLHLIAETAARVPWEAPKTFYEALNTCAFLRKTMGALEGVGFNSFGRLDLDLFPFYEADIQSGRLTPEDGYDLICQFLVTFDMHYDHDMPMVGYSDHELENTYVLGGCDEEGIPVYNALTEMFLRATREEKIVYPKIKCRFSADSPKEYLDAIDQSVINSTSTILYQNDDAVIPALVRDGKPLAEARDYIVHGCWGMTLNGCEKPDSGNYVNILKAFEYSIHADEAQKEAVNMPFQKLDNAKTFEDVYQITLENIRILFAERLRIGTRGGQVWDQVDALPLFSSTLENCLEKGLDFTSGGAKYQDHQYMCVGFPNIVDSLLSIRRLCFEDRICTLPQLLDAVRRNWQDCGELRAAAIHSPGWGDGQETSCELANRFNNDLFRLLEELSETIPGRIRLGHLTYTEIKWWGEKTKATPDGRYDGDYFSQGLTPSRLKKISSVTNVVRSFAQLDASTMAGNTVVNILLPSNRITLDICEAFLRACANSAIQSLQLNCVTREQLLDAQRHPENYPELIVRVCGFSAKFTSLARHWQDEVLSRNFYD